MSIRKWAKVLHFNLNTISHCCKQLTGIKEHCKSFAEHSFFSTFTYVLTLIFLAYNTRMSWRLAFALQCGHLPPWPFNHLSIQLKFRKENSIVQHIHKKLKTVLNMTWKFHLSNHPGPSFIEMMNICVQRVLNTVKQCVFTYRYIQVLTIGIY